MKLTKTISILFLLILLALNVNMAAANPSPFANGWQNQAHRQRYNGGDFGYYVPEGGDWMHPKLGWKCDWVREYIIAQDPIDGEIHYPKKYFYGILGRSSQHDLTCF